jgi:hypothetical protein
MKFKKRLSTEGFSGGQYGFFEAWSARHAIHGKLGYFNRQGVPDGINFRFSYSRIE